MVASNGVVERSGEAGALRSLFFEDLVAELTDFGVSRAAGGAAEKFVAANLVAFHGVGECGQFHRRVGLVLGDGERGQAVVC